MKTLCRAFGLLILVSFLAVPLVAADTAPDDQEAIAIIKQMSDFLTNQESFTVHAENTRDELLVSGQMVQYAAGVDLAVMRPGSLRAEVTGDRRNLLFTYDGKQVTLLHTDKNYYAHLEAPGSIDTALQYALDSFNLETPLAFLVYRNPGDYLTAEALETGYLGIHRVLGIPCHHLTIRGPETDMQLWIEAGEKPLPRKLVVTEKRVAGAPQFTALITNWTLAPELSPETFVFQKPEGAQQIEFLPVRRHGVFK